MPGLAACDTWIVSVDPFVVDGGLKLAVAPLDRPFRLNSCGILIVNPPWRLDVELPPFLQRLGRLLEQTGESRVEVGWLSPE